MLRIHQKKKISIVIPTLFRCPELTVKLISQLNYIGVGEIIVINNTGGFLPLENCIILNQTTNIFVNPAWNLGVITAAYDYIGLLNDDILIPDNVLDFDFKKYEIVGISHRSISDVDSLENYKAESSLSETNHRNWGYGIAMFMQKENYKMIPEQLKIWCGDDYLFRNCRSRGQLNTKIKTRMSTTSKSREFYALKKADQRAFRELRI